MRKRAWIAALLVAVPLVVYWPAVFHEYGFRDDYAHLREVRERPGWLVGLTTSSGRPIYGAVLEASVRGITQVTDLPLLRLLGVLLLAVTGVLLWLYLRRAGWSDLEAATYAALVTLLPGAQVVATWAIAWPIALGLVIAIAGYALVDRGLGLRGAQRTASVAAGAVLYFAAGLTYQTSAMFVIGPLAAALLVRRSPTLAADARWVAAHVATLFVGLLAAYLVMRIVFAAGLVPEAGRMHFEAEPLAKLVWFVSEPVPNALALFALRDRFVDYAAFWVVCALMLGVVLLGFLFGTETRQQRWRWLVCVLVLPFVAHGVSLAANTQAVGYRTLLPLSGIVLALVVFALGGITRRCRLRRATVLGVFAAVVAVAAGVARYQSFELMAVPQSREWQIVKDAVATLDIEDGTRIYVIRPGLGDRSTERVTTDEFGSVSADAAWSAVEMVRAAVRQRFPAGVPGGARYTVTTSFHEPLVRADFDLVIDMRVLYSLGDRTTPGGCPPIWRC